MIEKGDPKKEGFFWKKTKEERGYEEIQTDIEKVNKEIMEENERHRQKLQELQAEKEKLDKEFFEVVKKI